MKEDVEFEAFYKKVECSSFISPTLSVAGDSYMPQAPTSL